MVALGLGVFFWDSPLLLPLKLLVVMMHESGHAIATWIVGGSVERLTVAADQSGACLSRIPDSALRQIIVYSAGYVGSAVAGGALMLATFRFKLHRAILGAAAVWLCAFAFILGGDAFTLLFCLGAGALLGVGAKLLPDWAVDVVNLVLAAFSALYAVFDLRDDLWDGSVRAVSDAALLAELTHVPALIWAGLWSAFSVAILAWAAWTSLRTRKPPPLALPVR